MKNKILSLAILLALCAVAPTVYAVPASPDSINYEQPDGSKLTLFIKGDEYYHWTETSNNNIVIKNNDFYEYATIEDNNIVPSGVRVSEHSISDTKQISSKDDILNVIRQKRSLVINRMDSLCNDRATTEVIPTTGNQKVLCILMGFPDMPFTKSKADFQNMWNQIGYNYQGSQGSVKDFYLENSYGQLNVTATVVGPYVASHNSSYYDTGDDISSSNVRELIREAILAARDEIFFGDFDVNQDYYVDAVHVVFAGYNKSITGSPGVIWPHHWALSTPVNQYILWKAKDYICTPELAGNSDSLVAPIGTVCHEYGHRLGAPDFYDPADYYKGTGRWDVMCKGNWNGPSGNSGRCPSHHNPYTKAYIYNWATPMIINSYVSNTLYTLQPSHNTSSFYRINTNATGEFFLIENKKKMGFNSYFPYTTNNDGLLIYHIHKDIQQAIENQTVNTSHPQKCYIVSANATTNPNSNPSSYGTNDALWAYPTSNQIFFTSTSIPSATSWSGSSTGVNLCFIQKNGSNIQFVVNPVINGPSVLDSTAQYSVSNVPTCANVKWTYSSNVSPSSPPSSYLLYPPVSFIENDCANPVLVKRGKYRSFLIPSDTLPSLPPGINGNITPNVVSQWDYYTGTIILKATISSGGDTIRLTKTITLPDTNVSKESTQENITDKPSNYQIVTPNPVNTSNLPINLYYDKDGEIREIEEPYTVELWDNKYGLIKRLSGNDPNISMQTGSLQPGLYHLILIINGEIKANKKIIVQ